MNLKKILIIAPDSRITHNKSFPIGPHILPYLAALTPGDIEVELIDMGRQKCDYDAKVDLVCVTCLTPMAVRAEEVCRNFRKRGIKVAIGGHHPTVRPIECKAFSDMVFIGEAEETYPQMLKDFKNDQLSDFYVCGDSKFISQLPGKVYHIKQRPSLENLPIPRKDLFKVSYRFDTIQTTRGCPFKCDFCSVPEYYGAKIRRRPLTEVSKEIDSLSSIFYLLDDNCFDGSPYSMDFFRMMINRKQRKLWLGQGSLSIVNHPKCDEILSLAAKSGLRLVQVGIESLDPSNLVKNNISSKLGHKGVPDLEFTKKAIKKLQSYGILVWGFIIFGFMDDTEEIFKIAEKFVDETNIIPCFAILNLLPETKLYHTYKDYLIPSRGYDAISAPFATMYVKNIRPNRLEDETNRIQLKSYSWGKIFKRLMHTHPKNMIMSLMIQKSMRDIFNAYTSWMHEYRLADNEQFLAEEYINKINQNRSE